MRDLSRRRFIRNVSMGGALGLMPSTGLLNLESFLPAINQDASLARRRAHLAQLRAMMPATRRRYPGRMNAHDRTWEDWLDRTGELPPDFATMVSQPFLPDPLRLMVDGSETRIRTVADWERIRPWIKAQYEQWIVGRMPPAPTNLRATVTSEKMEGSVTVREIQLEFGPDHKATLGLQLQVPPGDGPFPVFLCNHPRRRPWVNTAVRRGYAGCSYYALDAYYGAPDDSDPWIDVYPDYDFAEVARWAWGAMRAVDYVTSLPFIRKDQVCISGHSRQSKQALLAAAFDERIGAVVPSRGNTGDQVPWRFASEMFDGESLEIITRSTPHWFHPRLRFFVGHEDALPVDQNLMMGLIAPRGLLFSHASMEHQGNPVGVEVAYRSVQQVYDLYGKRGNLGLYQQPGEHPSSVEDVETYFDFFDTVFGRASHAVPEMWTLGYTFDSWKAKTGQSAATEAWPVRRVGDYMDGGLGPAVESASDWTAARATIRNRVRWALGEEPPALDLPRGRDSRGNAQVSYGWRGDLMANRPWDDWEFMRNQRVLFGDDLSADLYYPDAIRQGGSIPQDASVPVVLWCHGYSYTMGYGQYALWAGLIQAGFAVLCFDHIGFGVRNQHSLHFYERYKNWSLLGKMVADTQAAIDQLLRIRWIDSNRIFATGYSLGGKIALFTAAVDDRIAGASVRCAFAPLRLTGGQQISESIRHYSDIHGLLPKLGFFIDEPERLPVDYDEIVASLAPRPVQIVAPEMDRYNPVEHVKQGVEAARRAYTLLGASSALEINSVLDWNRWAKFVDQEDWLARQAGLPAIAR